MIDLQGLLNQLRDLGAQCGTFIPRDNDGHAILAILIVDEPDQEQIDDLDALTSKWNDEGGA